MKFQSYIISVKLGCMYVFFLMSSVSLVELKLQRAEHIGATEDQTLATGCRSLGIDLGCQMGPALELVKSN